MGISGKITTWIILAVACNVVIRFFLVMDYNKTVYSHSPGPCIPVEGIGDGAEDIELLPDETALISSGLVYSNQPELKYVKGQIFLFDLKEKTLSPRAIPLKIKTHQPTFNPKTFNPHGISSYVSKGQTGTYTQLYVVNHPPGGDTIERFTLNKDRTLSHTKTIRDAYIYSGNDLVVVGPDRFFLTNDHYFTNHYLRLLERILLLNLGNVIYYDGSASSIVDSWMLSPNGVAVNKNMTHLYVASPLGEFVRAYNMNKDLATEKHLDMTLMTSPDNLYVDPESGDIWAGCHPIGHLIMKHLTHPKSQRAPSQVLRIRPQEGHNSWTVTEPFADDGRVISGSTVAVFHKDQLLIGSLNHKLLVCQAPDKDLL